LLEVELGQGLDPGQAGFLDPAHHPCVTVVVYVGGRIARRPTSYPG
jgi:hypothetical protein